MKKWIGMLLCVAMLFSFAACGTKETAQPGDDSSLQQSDAASSEEVSQPSGSDAKEAEPAKAELKYNTGYYSFEDLNDGFIEVRSLVFYDDGTVDYDWATYDYTTVGDYKLEYGGKPIYMVAGPSGDTFSYTVSNDKITAADWNGQNTVFVLASDGTLKIEKTTSESFTQGKEFAMQ